MLELFLAAALAAAPAVCLPFDPAELVVDRQALGDGGRETLQVYAVSRRGEESLFGYVSSRVVVYGPDCGVRYQQMFDGAVETHFLPVKLGERSVLLATTMFPGGSGVGYVQTILGYDSFSVYTLAPERLRYSNLDGFHLGDLGDGRGEALMVWEANGDGAGHYGAQSYTVKTYRWRKDHFTGPKVWTTRRQYDPEPAEVARALGLPPDQTDPARFKLFDAR
jgi:hypothetical protein